MKKLFLLFTLCIGLATSVSAQNKGYEIAIDANGGPGLKNHVAYTVGLSVINGYRFSPNLFIGAGLGFRYVEEAIFLKSENQTPTINIVNTQSEPQYTILPYLRIKANLSRTNLSPFILLDFGYSFALGHPSMKSYDGIFIEPQFGIDFNYKKRTALFLSLGLNMQDFQYQHTITSPENTNYNEIAQLFVGMINIHLGIRF